MAALGYGWSIDREPAPPRIADQTVPVDRTWYDSVPLDPSSAVEAYLARVPAEMRARGEAYSDTRLLGFGLRVLTLVLATAAMCFTGLGARMRDAATRISSRPLFVDAAVALQYFLAICALGLPAEVYFQFARPHRFGFSDQPFVAWLGDFVANWVVFTIFYLIGVIALYRCIRRWPMGWILLGSAIYFVLRFLYAVLSPTVIEPLTNDFRPMSESGKKDVILALASANGIRDARVVVGDASRQSRLMNAHVSGFGPSTRITIDDTTLRQTNESMLRFVMAHEIGHFVLDHDIASAFTDTLIASVGFALVALTMRLLLHPLGARLRVSRMEDIAGLPLFWGLFLLWGFLSLPVANAISRVYERQADIFGLNASRAPHGMAEFMIHDSDTARLNPSPLEYALFYSHPSDVERIRAAMQWRAAMNR